MTINQLIAYLKNQGIDHTETGKGLRVMDKSLLPQTYRDWFDERGFLKEGKVKDEEKKEEEAAVEAARQAVKELDKIMPMGETEKEMTVIGLLNPNGDTNVPAHLESHEPKTASVLEKMQGLKAATEEVAEEQEGEEEETPAPAKKAKGKKK